ncbi:hypothetical protein CTI12_AA427060 [Artemisia annua]|uniref:Uncharacterized protein n=1 Tax=Artemisia annua TaxID=35608 RepID=A0A2U1LMI0_ARTAN|nr:hypothetical protein CTI12_AA427060 [Artemisia annua]
MEEETLMMLNNTREVEQVKVIEYMLSSMSKELLCKFPDNSAFDFDYTQSSIWSPLVPHPSNPSSPLNTNGLQKKLSYEDEENEEDGASMMVKKFTENVVDKVSGSCVFSCFGAGCKIGNKKVGLKRRRSSFRGLGHLGSASSSTLGVDRACSSPIQNKGWKKVLKAATKQFKKTMKKKDSGAHLKLSSNGYTHLPYYY